MYKTILLAACTLCISCETTQTIEPAIDDKTFTAVDAHKVIVLGRGSDFQIVLPSNPTTGYQWSVESDHPEVVRMQSEDYVADQSDRVGVGGESIWVFRTKQTGKSAITFSYERPWEEKVKPSRVVTFELDVR